MCNGQYYCHQIGRFCCKDYQSCTLSQRAKTRNYYLKQIFRSGTSIGANVSESNNAQSKSDFENKLNIALKEADETAYWLRILKRTDYLTKEEFDSIYSDVTEIIAILIASIRTSRGENPKKNGNSSTSPHKE